VQGDAARGLEHYERFEALARAVADATGTPRDQRDVVTALGARGDALAELERLAEGLQAQQAAAELLDTLESDDPQVAAILRRDRTVVATRIGDLLHRQGDVEGALRQYRVSLAIDESRRQERPESPLVCRDLTVDQLRVAETLAELNRLDEALPLAEEAVGLRERLHQEDPANAQLHRDLATAHYTLYELHVRRAQDPSRGAETRLAAVDSARRALEHCTALFHELQERGPLRAADAEELQQTPARLAALEALRADLQALLPDS
jgi:tetratricopeptide (TPR) repeat protein